MEDAPALEQQPTVDLEAQRQATRAALDKAKPPALTAPPASPPPGEPVPPPTHEPPPQEPQPLSPEQRSQLGQLGLTQQQIDGTDPAVLQALIDRGPGAAGADANVNFQQLATPPAPPAGDKAADDDAAAALLKEFGFPEINPEEYDDETLGAFMGATRKMAESHAQQQQLVQQLAAQFVLQSADSFFSGLQGYEQHYGSPHQSIFLCPPEQAAHRAKVIETADMMRQNGERQGLHLPFERYLAEAHKIETAKVQPATAPATPTAPPPSGNHTRRAYRPTARTSAPPVPGSQQPKPTQEGLAAAIAARKQRMGMGNF